MNERTPLRSYTPAPVAPRHQLRKRHSEEFRLHVKQELAVIDMVEIPEKTRLHVHELLRDAMARTSQICVLLAFYMYSDDESKWERVADTERWERELKACGGRMREPVPVARDQLTLDVHRHTTLHTVVASVMNYVGSEMDSPLHLIVSRQRVTMPCAPDPENSVWWKRYWSHERTATYYKILVDFSQSKPMHEVRIMT